MAYIPNSGSVASWIQSDSASVITVGQSSIAVVIIGGSILTSSTANQSVSGTVGASVIGTVPIVQSGTLITSIVSIVPSSVLVGASIYGQLPGGTAMLGSVVSYQGAIPWTIGSIYGNISGSVVATITGNPSISGTVLVNNGSVVAFQGGSPWSFTTPAGSIMAVSGVSVSISSVSQAGTWNVSVTSTVPSSVLVGASIYGQLPAGSAVIGSITALQGTNPWIETFSNSSIIAVPVGSVITVSQSSSVIGVVTGSVLSIQSGTRSTSIVGGASVFQYGTWNVSVTGTVVNLWGSPTASWVSGSTSLLTGVYQPVAGSVAGQFTYITAVQVANASANNAYLTFSGAGIGSTVGSIIGYTVVPANGGSNIVYTNALKTGSGAPFQASLSGVASVFISAQGFTSGT